MEPHGDVSTLLTHPFTVDAANLVIHALLTLVNLLPW